MADASGKISGGGATPPPVPKTADPTALPAVVAAGDDGGLDLTTPAREALAALTSGVQLAAVALNPADFERDPLAFLSSLGSMTIAPNFVSFCQRTVDRLFPTDETLERGKLDPWATYLKEGSSAKGADRMPVVVILRHLLNRPDERTIHIAVDAPMTAAEYLVDQLIRDVESRDPADSPTFQLLVDAMSGTEDHGDAIRDTLADYYLKNDPHGLAVVARLAQELHRLHHLPTVDSVDQLNGLESMVRSVVESEKIRDIARAPVGSTQFKSALKYVVGQKITTAIPALRDRLNEEGLEKKPRKQIKRALEALGTESRDVTAAQQALVPLLHRAISDRNKKEEARIRALLAEQIQAYQSAQARDFVDAHSRSDLPKLDFEVEQIPFPARDSNNRLRKLYNNIEAALKLHFTIETKVKETLERVHTHREFSTSFCDSRLIISSTNGNPLSGSEITQILNVITHYFHSDLTRGPILSEGRDGDIISHESIDLIIRSDELTPGLVKDISTFVEHAGLGTIRLLSSSGDLLLVVKSASLPSDLINVSVPANREEQSQLGRALFDRLTQTVRSSPIHALGATSTRINLSGDVSSADFERVLGGLMAARSDSLAEESRTNMRNSVAIPSIITGAGLLLDTAASALFGIETQHMFGMLSVASGMALSLISFLNPERQSALPARTEIQVDGETVVVIEGQLMGSRGNHKLTASVNQNHSLAKEAKAALAKGIGIRGLTFTPDADRMGKDQEALGSGSKEDVSIDQGLPEDEPMITIAENFGTEFYRTTTEDQSNVFKELMQLPGFNMIPDDVLKWASTIPPTIEHGLAPDAESESDPLFSDDIKKVAIEALGLGLALLFKNPNVAATATSVILTPIPESPEKQVERYRRRLMQDSL